MSSKLQSKSPTPFTALFPPSDSENSCWHQFKAQQLGTRPLNGDEPGDDKEVQVVGL